MSTLLLTKTSVWCRAAQAIVRERCQDLTIAEGERGTPIPDRARSWSGDLILSFCAPWILPASMLAQAALALNFHPAPPEHPGFAPYSWAIYNQERTYGVTVHKMVTQVDSGPIVRVDRFALDYGLTVYLLQQKAMMHLIAMLVEMTDPAYVSQSCEEKWIRQPRTKADFEALRRVTPSMSQYEVWKRTQACTYPGQPGVVS